MRKLVRRRKVEVLLLQETKVATNIKGIVRDVWVREVAVGSGCHLTVPRGV